MQTLKMDVLLPVYKNEADIFGIHVETSCVSCFISSRCCSDKSLIKLNWLIKEHYLWWLEPSLIKIYFCFQFGPSNVTEGGGAYLSTAAYHQGEIKRLCSHFWGALIHPYIKSRSLCSVQGVHDLAPFGLHQISLARRILWNIIDSWV